MLVKNAFVDVFARTPEFELEGITHHKITYLQFPRLSKEGGCKHAVLTRHGGVSRPPFHTLNTAYATGDDQARVTTNLEITKRLLGARELKFMNQVHSTGILVLRRHDHRRFYEALDGDAIITDMTGVALMVKQADCQAVILYDPERRVIANVHCGWRGNTQDILGSAVARMTSDFKSDPAHMKAAIGPSLGPCCAEFVSHSEIFPEAFRPFMVRENYFDLWKLSCRQLIEAGINRKNIELAGICTRCRTDLFYSYRAEGVTGRFATLVMLR